MRHCFNLECESPNSVNRDRCADCKKSLVLKGKYVAVDILGKGGFGKTYLGLDLQRTTYFAIKQLLHRDPSGLPLDPHARKLFRREAEQLRKLGGGYEIPDFIDFFEEDGTLYIVSEYIEGKTLRALVRGEEDCGKGRNGTTTIVFNEDDVVYFLLNMLLLLKRIHHLGVIHRDIKPENVMWRDSSYVLIDFGAARVLSSPSNGTIIVSGSYSPEEQLRGQSSYASDIYGLGVTCLFLLTGREPHELQDSHTRRWIWRDFLGTNEVTEDLALVLDRMVSRRQQERYSSAQEVLEALTVRRRRSSEGGRSSPLAGLLLALACVLFAWLLSSRPETSSEPRTSEPTTSVVSPPNSSSNGSPWSRQDE